MPSVAPTVVQYVDYRYAVEDWF